MIRIPQNRAVALALAIAGVASLAMFVPTTASASTGSGLDELRASTKQFQNFDAAGKAGYGLLVDMNGIACIDKPGEGAMGIHYVKGGLVGDARELARQPEALVYEPQASGRMRLVAVEYVVTKAAWEGAGNTAPPSLFGQEFMFVAAGNRYGLPDFYALHVWLWKHNPHGLFAPWNPNVTCAHA